MKLDERARTRNSLAVQCLGPGAFTTAAPGLIPGQVTKIHKVQQGQEKKTRAIFTYKSILNIKTQ